MHTGFGYTDSQPAQHFYLWKNSHFPCAPAGFQTRVTDFIESRVRHSTNGATLSPLTVDYQATFVLLQCVLGSASSAAVPVVDCDDNSSISLRIQQFQC